MDSRQFWIPENRGCCTCVTFIAGSIMGGGSGPHHRPHVVFTMQECNTSSIINIGSFMGGAQDLIIAPMWCFSVQCKNATIVHHHQLWGLSLSNSSLPLSLIDCPTTASSHCPFDFLPASVCGCDQLAPNGSPSTKNGLGQYCPSTNTCQSY
jgi:hypothetical protein